MKKTVVGLCLTVAVFVCSAVFSKRHALACELLPVLGNRAIAHDVYVGDDISSDRSDALRDLVNSAADRISSVYGAPVSIPRFLITSDSQHSKIWGANETASMHRLPWRSCIIIGPKGQNIDVIAHESLHAEVQHRVGFWRFLTEVPIWFDEGAALTVDYREPYLPDKIDLSASEIEAVQKLESAQDFFSGDVRKNYLAARMAVRPLIQRDRFFENLESLSLGSSFDAVFLRSDAHQADH